MIAAVGASGTNLEGLNQTRRLGKLIQNSVMGYLQNLLLFSSRIISNSTTAAYKGVLSLIFSLMVGLKHNFADLNTKHKQSVGCTSLRIFL
jgi:hypothetical protein